MARLHHRGVVKRGDNEMTLLCVQAQRKYDEEPRNWVDVKNPRDMQLVEDLVTSVREWLAGGASAEPEAVQPDNDAAIQAVQPCKKTAVQAVQPAVQVDDAGVVANGAVERKEQQQQGAGGGEEEGPMEMDGVEYEAASAVAATSRSEMEETAAAVARGEAEAAARRASAAALGASSCLSSVTATMAVVTGGVETTGGTGIVEAAATAAAGGGVEGGPRVEGNGAAAGTAAAGGGAEGGVRVEGKSSGVVRGAGPLLLPLMNGFQRLLAYQTLRTTEWGAGPGEHRGFWIGKVRGFGFISLV
jgi:hypothetical protein